MSFEFPTRPLRSTHEYVEHFSIDVEGFRVTDATSTGHRPHDDLIWIGCDGLGGRWLKPEAALEVASAIQTVVHSHASRHGETDAILSSVASFTFPDGAIVDGYRIDPSDGLRYPFGRCESGVWSADQFGWASWKQEADRLKAWAKQMAVS